MSEKVTAEMLIAAYMNGYFPMPHPDTDELVWFHPNPRAIIPLDRFCVSRSLRRSIRKYGFSFTINQAFSDVMKGCAARSDTWINGEIFELYTALQRLGFCYSVEVWRDGVLAGGLYGVTIGGAFFAESKFHNVTDASKAALWHLVEHMKARGMSLLEVQFITPHLQSLGAIEVTTQTYMEKLEQALLQNTKFLP